MISATSLSLRVRLLCLITLPLVLGLVLIGAGTYLSAKSAAEQIYDSQLAHFARVLGLLSRQEIGGGKPEEKIINLKDKAFTIPYTKDFFYRVWYDGRLILQSDNAVDFDRIPQKSGFVDWQMGHRSWRVFVLEDSPIRVETAEDYHLRRDALHHVGLSILLPLFLIIPLLLLVVWIGVLLGIAPLKHISALIQQQTPENLQPITYTATPKEVLPLVRAFNQLIDQINRAMEREKRFTRYAAHELSTPMAALKTQIQVAMREKKAQTRNALVAEMVQIVDRLTHLLEQLLFFARAQQQQIQRQHLCLSEVITVMTDQFRPLAASRHQQFTTQIAPSVFLQGNAELLSIMLRNLLDNAMRYSPERAHIAVVLETDAANPEHFTLRVSNDGITLSEAELERLFDPFYRPSLANHPQGSGLGLAIVANIATTHHLHTSHLLEGQCFTMLLKYGGS